MGIYLLGKIRLPHDSKLESIGVIRMMISIFFLTFGLYLSNGLWGGKVYGLIDSYLPPKQNYLQEKSLNKNFTEEIWIQNYDEGVQLSKEMGKPIFIDFTGYTCTNCRWMEVNVFVNDEVKKLFKGNQ